MGPIWHPYRNNSAPNNQKANAQWTVHTERQTARVYTRYIHILGTTYVYIYICMYMFKYIYISHIYIYVCINKYIYNHIYMYV